MHQKSIFCLLLVLTFNVSVFCLGVPPEAKSSFSNDGKQNKTETVPVPVLNLNNIDNANNKEQEKVINKTTNATNHNGSVRNYVNPNSDLLQSGAIERAFYVLLGGTVLLMIFLGFRMYRLRSGATRPVVMVKKYGVLANRTDVEMLPFSLEEDDEDDTVFEVNQEPIESDR